MPFEQTGKTPPPVGIAQPQTSPPDSSDNLKCLQASGSGPLRIEGGHSLFDILLLEKDDP